MSETGRGGINRAFSWLKKVLQITEKTVAPDSLLPDVRSTLDLFAWERLAEPVTRQFAAGALAANVVGLPTVPDGVMRYYQYLSVGHDDPAGGGLSLSLQIRSAGFDFGVDIIHVDQLPDPMKSGITKPLLLRPGESLFCFSDPAPAAGQQLLIRGMFIDIEVGEYIRSI